MFGRGCTAGEDARPWAIALLRRATSDDAQGEVLDDGSVLRRTALAYVPLTLDGVTARTWLASLRDELSSVHDDPRGVLFFPDVLHVRARTYAEVVAEVGWSGVWVAAPLEGDEPVTFGACPPGRAPSASPRCGSS